MAMAKGYSKPDPEDAVATLGFYFLRAEVLMLQWRGVEFEIQATGDPDAVMQNVSSGYPPKQWTYWLGHLAALSTVIEGWLNLKLVDGTIDQLLQAADGQHRAQLKEVRHAVF